MLSLQDRRGSETQRRKSGFQRCQGFELNASITLCNTTSLSAEDSIHTRRYRAALREIDVSFSETICNQIGTPNITFERVKGLVVPEVHYDSHRKLADYLANRSAQAWPIDHHWRLAPGGLGSEVRDDDRKAVFVEHPTILTESNNYRNVTQLFIDQANHHPLIDVLIQNHLRIRGEGRHSWERSLLLSAFSEGELQYKVHRR
jgi:hypothetical protein